MRPWFMLLSLTVTTLYLFIPNKGQVGFVMDEVTLSYRQYAWLIGDQLAWVLFTLGVWLDPKPYRNLMCAYFFLRFMDLVGWIISYDDLLTGFPITFNILKIFIFLAVITVNNMKNE
jgi:hypothetical protein